MKTATLTLWMKSGSKIRIPFITDWSFKTDGEHITYVKIQQNQFLRKLFRAPALVVPAISLADIEAVAVQ
jgi:hypothetical protein